MNDVVGAQVDPFVSVRWEIRPYRSLKTKSPIGIQTEKPRDWQKLKLPLYFPYPSCEIPGRPKTISPKFEYAINILLEDPPLLFPQCSSEYREVAPKQHYQMEEEEKKSPE